MEENASPIRNLPLLKSKMFPSPGRPARIVCCFREPAGTINSHLKKFPHHILETVPICCADATAQEHQRRALRVSRALERGPLSGVPDPGVYDAETLVGEALQGYDATDGPDEDRFFDAARPLYYKPIFHTTTGPECRFGVFYHREKLFGKLSRSCACFPVYLPKSPICYALSSKRVVRSPATPSIP